MIHEAGTRTQDSAYAYSRSRSSMVGSKSSGTADASNHWNHWSQTTRTNIWSLGLDEPIGTSSSSSSYSPWLALVLNYRAHARAQSRARVDTRAENGIQFSRVVPAVWPPMKMWPALGYTTTSSRTSESSKFKFDPFADDEDEELPGSRSDYASDSDADISESTNASPTPAILPLLDDSPKASSLKFDPFADDNDDDSLPVSRSDSPSESINMAISTNSSPTPALIQLPLPDNVLPILPPLVESHNTESDVDDESVPDWCSLENIKMRIIERRTVFDIHDSDSDIELVQRATGLRRLKALAPKPFDPEKIHQSDFVDRPMDVQAVNDVDRFFNKGPRTNLKWYEEQDTLNSNRGTLTGKVTSDAKLEQLVDAKYTRQRGDGENRGELLRMLNARGGL
ncbi:hypothetical protein C8R42DRAFT_646261 [Lentinula raphanica]|nr:hypothetical protein C8R42DRAFT_646261 [Lentinula raphanica]